MRSSRFSNPWDRQDRQIVVSRQLVLGCVGTKFSNERLSLKHFSNLHNCSGLISRILQYFVSASSFANVCFSIPDNVAEMSLNLSGFHRLFVKFHPISGLQRLVELCCRFPKMLQNSCKWRPQFSENLPKKSSKVSSKS